MVTQYQSWYAGHREQRKITNRRWYEANPERLAWMAARARTSNPNHPRFKDYGGRGITMCKAWIHDFDAFLSHIGPKPRPELTLERIDNDRGYEPGNVRWATYREQALNRRPRS